MKNIQVEDNYSLTPLTVTPPADPATESPVQNSLSPNSTTKAPSVAAVNAGLGAVDLRLDDFAVDMNFEILRLDDTVVKSVNGVTPDAFGDVVVSGGGGGATVQNSLSPASTVAAPSVDAVTNGLSSKANLNSPAFTGIPTGPTAATMTNSSQVATTAFVQNTLNNAPLIVAHDYKGVIRTDFTNIFDATFWSQANSANPPANGAYGGFGGYIFLNRPHMAGENPHMGQNQVLDLRGNPLNLNGGFLHMYCGAKIINNSLIFNGTILMRNGADPNNKPSIQGGVLSALIDTRNATNNPMLLDGVTVTNYGQGGTSTVGAGTVILRNGSKFQGWATDPATTITTEVVSSTGITSATLSIAGSDLTLNTSAGNSTVTLPSGGGGTSYTLPAATDSSLGGVKVGSNLTVSGDGTLSAVYSTVAPSHVIDLIPYQYTPISVGTPTATLAAGTDFLWSSAFATGRTVYFEVVGKGAVNSPSSYVTASLVNQATGVAITGGTISGGVGDVLQRTGSFTPAALVDGVTYVVHLATKNTTTFLYRVSLIII